MSTAIYTCNFGNYRNEIKEIDNILIDNNIDYYFFTDNINLQSKIWKIINCPLIPGDDTMSSFRWTSKYVKFVLPDILKKYDIVVWCDTKLLKKPLNINTQKITNLFLNNNYKLINIKHPYRKTQQEELTTTIRYNNCENKTNGTFFLNEIKNIVYSTPLTDTCFIIRKNDNITNNLFENVYELLKQHKLARDQNVYCHAIYSINYPIENISYINNIDWIYN